MPIQTINLGTYANDGTGDDLRTAFEKVNENFTFLDNLDARDSVNLGLGAPVFATKLGTTFQFRSLAAGNNMAVTYDGTTITLATTSTFTGNVTGNLTGNITGNLTGNVTGNLSGTATSVSDISNHNIAELADVASTTALEGQILTYQGSLWRPVTASSNIAVNVNGNLLTTNATTINFNGSGISGTAVGSSVTVSVVGGGTFDFGSFTNPSGITVDFGSLI